MLRVNGLTITLGGFHLRDVSFSVAQGDYFALLGASGVGKTVLLEAIAGFRPPDQGTVFLKDKDITCQPIQKRNVAMVHQAQTLFPHMSVARNIGYGLQCTRLPRQERQTRIAELADQVGAAIEIVRSDTADGSIK